MNEQITLTSQQQNAVDEAFEYVSDDFNEEYLSIGGYAGTGKTTVLKALIEKISDYDPAPCAFTGKAALRMRQKGVLDAGTIHSLIYHYVKDINAFRKRVNVDGDYFLVDEASMIPKSLWIDLLSYEKPIILVGDLGQLEPIGNDPKLMKNPDIILDKIHRQAEASSIIKLATNIRLDKNWFDCSAYNHEDVEFIRPRMRTADHLLEADIVICAFNRTRLALNQQIRGLLGRNDELNIGDKIICLANNSKIGVFNGQMFVIEELLNESDKCFRAKIRTECEEPYIVNLYKAQFNHPKNLARDGKWVTTKSGRKRFQPTIEHSERYMFADFGYAITCHKSQGSEWDNVLVIDEQAPRLWDAKRWRYTAVTRAARKLRFVV